MNLFISLARFFFGVYCILYTLVHILTFVFPLTTNYFLFHNYVYWPFNNLSKPESLGLTNVHNFYVSSEIDVKIGVWHFIPENFKYDYEVDSKDTIKGHFEKFFSQNTNITVIIYIHGSAGDRSGNSRIKICQNLSNLGYHVFSIDVRGYGDSSGWPSEEGVVKDALILYNNIKTFINMNSKVPPNIYLYGHSIGAGIVCHAAKLLSGLDSPPAGLLLESPFINISQAAKEYILAPLFLNNPWIRKRGEDNLDLVNLHFSNDKYISLIKSKTLIIHAEDDFEIPIRHSNELFELCKKYRPKDWPTCRLLQLEKNLNLGHSGIYSYQKIYSIIKNFIEQF